MDGIDILTSIDAIGKAAVQLNKGNITKSEFRMIKKVLIMKIIGLDMNPSAKKEPEELEEVE